MREWWINDIGENLLFGVPNDTSNPVRLPDDYIQDFLTRIEAARESYLRLLHSLTDEEKARLAPLYNRAVVAKDLTDEKIAMDRIQNSWNRAGVRTSGPRGGTRTGGNR